MASNTQFRFAIDRGGTFTDVYCEICRENGENSAKVLKLLSELPSSYKDAPTEGIRRLLQEELQICIPKDSKIPTNMIDSIRMGTTVATNALLERKGERVAFLTTKGCRDLQTIGNQSRPKIFDLEIKKPELLYEYIAEVNERIVILKEEDNLTDIHQPIVYGLSKEKLILETPLNELEVLTELNKIKQMGINSLAVCLLHSYMYPYHEKVIGKLAQQVGFSQISLSHEIMPMVRIVPRSYTTCVDAYLTPVLNRYLTSFAQGFDSALMSNNKVSFMQSDGGLTSMNTFSGSRAILSGPAGGVVGFAVTSRLSQECDSITDTNNDHHSSSSSSRGKMAVVGFDMGGTSTDVSRYAGVYEHVFESTTAGVTIQSPQLDINTVAAGGGSRLFYRNGMFVVGPESAGADPGPTCYRKGGPLAITDANLLLGRVQPHLFPAIFGTSENERLDFEAAQSAFHSLTEDINSKQQQKVYTVDEVAAGFIRVANEAMARPIRNLTTMKGHDVTKHILATFGGAGPQHCCAVAKSLGIKEIFISKYSGVLSAYGLSLADAVVDKQEPFDSSELLVSMPSILTRLRALNESARIVLNSPRDHGEEHMTTAFYVNCRYQGTDTSIMTPFPSETSLQDADIAATMHASFVATYKREYGFELTDRAVLVDDVRVRVEAQSKTSQALNSLHHNQINGTSASQATRKKGSVKIAPREFVSVYFDETGRSDRTPVYWLTDLSDESEPVHGPAIIMQDITTIIIEPLCVARVGKYGDIIVKVDGSTNKGLSTELDPIYLSVFSHRFMGIAEQMGRALQRTSISVNIKERLDFSCALFDSDGGLVANAPHLPVHLGAMSEAVRYQKRYWGDDLADGDVLVSNHPQLAGGSHLPDITVITPIYINGVISFFLASRGHHADVGGIAPGSMPPLSKSLEEEGAAIIAFKLVQKGSFQEDGIVRLLQAPGQRVGNSGARNVQDNLSDLKAQVAANQKGASLMNDLVAEYSLEVIQAYMSHIQACAAEAVRGMLREFSLRQNMQVVDTVHAEDFLDDGTPIRLAVTIDRDGGSAIFDFKGTGHEVYGNLNAPPAVTASAIIYCLRCLLPESDIPLNQGCLTPITISIPDGCILKPSEAAAVVGGNVLTSQRVTDVVLKAFAACAASQGCMNNLTFGNETMGYYETIAGGAGAGKHWNGCSAVHTHMTNTRITDPEILEKRYPVILRQFSVRKGSGGVGRYRGGDGVIRELEFTQPLVVSILSERRALSPYGLFGGECGGKGLNLLSKHMGNSSSKYIHSSNSCSENDGVKTKKLKVDETQQCPPTPLYRTINIGSKNTVHVQSGDRLLIHTPGGGGYGHSAVASDSSSHAASHQQEESMQQWTTHDERRSRSVPMRVSGSLHDYKEAQETV